MDAKDALGINACAYKRIQLSIYLSSKGTLMNVQRRRLLQMSAIVGVMASAGLMTQAEAAAWNKAAFEA